MGFSVGRTLSSVTDKVKIRGQLSELWEQRGFTAAEKLNNAGITVEERRFSAALDGFSYGL